MWRSTFCRKYLSMDFSVSHLDFTYICCCSWFSSPVMSRVKHHCKLSPVPASCGAPIWPGPDLDQDFQLSSCHTETNNGSTLTPTNICHCDPVRRSVRISIIYLLMSPKWMDYLYQLVSFTQCNWLKNAITESRFFILNKYLNVYRICAMRLDLNNYHHPVSTSRYEAF